MKRQGDVRNLLVLALVFSAACSSQQPAPAASSPSSTSVPVRVLMVTATRGFRHDSIPVARDTMSSLAASTGAFTVATTEDVPSITRGALSNYDVLFFALTTGELPFDPDQKSAILEFVSSGKGFLGVHSATDTLYEWPEYGALVGAYFKEHPWTQSAGVIVEDEGHPATAGLGGRFTMTEEFYAFRDNPRPRVHVLLRLDAASVGASGDYPLAWTQSYGAGRSYYNALGHFSETWSDPRFQRQLLGAIQWVAKR
jgi:type 1 glutamine amidotransferase